VSALPRPSHAMAPDAELRRKQREFNAAMERYERDPAYQRFGRAVSVANVSLQAALLLLAWRTPVGAVGQLAALAVAWILADFVNGLVHMIMDGADGYTSPVGPLIAAFHLHHENPRYRRVPLPLVYFNESGAKVWLVAFQLLALLGGLLVPLPSAGRWVLAYFAILSSLAEVSHYACHVLDSRGARLLRRAGLLLSKRHHAPHHREDNVNYAFLNGVTDPLLNLVARRWGRGYKRRTDLHYATYAGPGTSNR